MKKLMILFLVTIIFVSGCTVGNDDKISSDIYDKSCIQNSDCVSETELRPGCAHYCEGNECTEDLMVCEAYNQKAGEIFVQCAKNEPCREPDRIGCVDNKCVVFENGIDAPPIEELKDCKRYFDGCNNCDVVDGKITGCTEIYCLSLEEPYCIEYY